MVVVREEEKEEVEVVSLEVVCMTGRSSSSRSLLSSSESSVNQSDPQSDEISAL